MPRHWVTRATRKLDPEYSRLDRAFREQSVEGLRNALQYGCCRDKLSPDLAAAFVELGPTERTLTFLRANPPHTLLAAVMRSVAGARAHAH
jgi:hypothetical protein